MFRSLIERFRDERNRKVADPAVRRWLSRFFLTRRLARDRTKALFDISAGFVYSQILQACVSCGLFTALADGPMSIPAIANATGLSPPATLRLLRAACSLKLTEQREDGAFALGSLGALMVGNETLTAMVRQNAALYRDFADPLTLLQGWGNGELSRYSAYSDGSRSRPRGNEHAGDDMVAASTSRDLTGQDVLDAYVFGKHRQLLDVGGDGSFAIAAARQAPDLGVMVFDLQPIAAAARRRVFAAGLSGRVKVYGGNVFDDPLPKGADLVTLNRVLQDHDDEGALRILKAVRAAVEPGATVLVAEPMAGRSRAPAAGDAYFGMVPLAAGQGRTREIDEIGRLLEKAGFNGCRLLATTASLFVQVIAAKAR